MVLIKKVTLCLLLMSSLPALSDDRISSAEKAFADVMLAANDGQKSYGTDDLNRRSGLNDVPERKSGTSSPKKYGKSTNITSGKHENLQRNSGGNKKKYVSKNKKRRDETSQRVKAERDRKKKHEIKNKGRLSDYAD